MPDMPAPQEQAFLLIIPWSVLRLIVFHFTVLAHGSGKPFRTSGYVRYQKENIRDDANTHRRGVKGLRFS